LFFALLLPPRVFLYYAAFLLQHCGFENFGKKNAEFALNLANNQAKSCKHDEAQSENRIEEKLTRKHETSSN